MRRTRAFSRQFLTRVRLLPDEYLADPILVLICLRSVGGAALVAMRYISEEDIFRFRGNQETKAHLAVRLNGRMPQVQVS